MEQIKFEPRIEILGPEQWQEYRDIRLKALKTDPQAFGQSYEQELAKKEEEIKKELSDPISKIYVTKVGERLVALVIATLITPGNVNHLAKIGSMFTDPEFRKQGIGEKLLAKVLDDLHKNPVTVRVALSVGVEQKAAQEMYKKLGFMEFGVGHKEMKYKGKYYDQVQMELIFEDKL